MLQLLIVLKIAFFMLSSEGMILGMKPAIENVMKYKNQMADCIDRHRKSTMETVIIICV